MNQAAALPRYVVFQHTVPQHREILRNRLGELQRISPLTPLAQEGEKGTWQGIEIACYSGPVREINLVPVLEQGPVEYIFSLGLVGALSDRLRVGHLVTPIASVRGDGLTDYWADAKLPAVANVTGMLAIQEAARQSGVALTSGIFYTTATMYREQDFLERWRGLGVIGVEMEMAQHFILAHLHGKKAAGVYVVSDTPGAGDEIWRTGVSPTPELLRAYEYSVDILLRAIQLLSGQPVDGLAC